MIVSFGFMISHTSTVIKKDTMVVHKTSII